MEIFCSSQELTKTTQTCYQNNNQPHQMINNNSANTSKKLYGNQTKTPNQNQKQHQPPRKSLCNWCKYNTHPKPNQHQINNQWWKNPIDTTDCRERNMKKKIGWENEAKVNILIENASDDISTQYTTIKLKSMSINDISNTSIIINIDGKSYLFYEHWSNSIWCRFSWRHHDDLNSSQNWCKFESSDAELKLSFFNSTFDTCVLWETCY